MLIHPGKPSSASTSSTSYFFTISIASNSSSSLSLRIIHPRMATSATRARSPALSFPGVRSAMVRSARVFGGSILE